MTSFPITSYRVHCRVPTCNKFEDIPISSKSEYNIVQNITDWHCDNHIQEIEWLDYLSTKKTVSPKPILCNIKAHRLKMKYREELNKKGEKNGS